MNINDKVYNSEDNEWKSNESTNLEDSDWGKFATGCLISIVGILVIGEISANFILYSKYANLVDKNTEDTNTKTYESIMKKIDPFFSNHGPEKDVFSIIFGWLAHTKDYDDFYGPNTQRTLHTQHDLYDDGVEAANINEQKATSLRDLFFKYINPY
tara:strand:- start:358 stop:825 length:468 start_codon:yes stop_codon:yes gene_type:complete